jgi:hypothetical protein
MKTIYQHHPDREGLRALSKRGAYEEKMDGSRTLHLLAYAIEPAARLLVLPDRAMNEGDGYFIPGARMSADAEAAGVVLRQPRRDMTVDENLAPIVGPAALAPPQPSGPPQVARLDPAALARTNADLMAPARGPRAVKRITRRVYQHLMGPMLEDSLVPLGEVDEYDDGGVVIRLDAIPVTPPKDGAFTLTVPAWHQPSQPGALSVEDRQRGATQQDLVRLARMAGR